MSLINEKQHSIFMDDVVIEAPSGRKTIINPVYAYVPDRDESSEDKFYGQMVDVAAELNECELFIDSGFRPSTFLVGLKEKGYKVYWRNDNEVGQG